jgi:hypothetical protein
MGAVISASRSSLPANFEADLRGIDLDALRREAFFGPDHKFLMLKHQARVERWLWSSAFLNFEGHLNELGEMWREKERLRVERIKATVESKRYHFSDEVLQIAMRSLDANGSV